MSERPNLIKRLDAFFSVAMIAHEAIFEMRRELIASDRGDNEQARLLHPEGAEVTLGEVEAELERIEPDVQSLLNRQREIATRLRSTLEP